MITKRQTIELIIDRIAGAGTPADLRRRYPYQVVEALLGNIFTDLAFTDPYSTQELSSPFDVTVTDVAPYTITLNPPALGSAFISSVEFGNTYFPVTQGGQESFVMRQTMPQGIPKARLYNGNTLILESKPIVANGVVNYIPDFRAMDEDTIFSVNGQQEFLYTKVLNLLAFTDRRAGEQYNDGDDDVMPVQTKKPIL